MSSTIGRNDPCPCGSGKKHKNCCYKRGVLFNRKKQNKIAIVVLLAVVVVAGAVSISKIKSSSSTPSPISRPPLSSAKTKPLPAPTSVVTSTKSQFIPQPPGPVPPGKVWSPNHGHWHDIPTTKIISSSTGASSNSSSPVFDILPEQLKSQTQSQTKLTPQPPGPVPAGKVWSPEHGHWHDAPAEPKVIQVSPNETDPK